MYILDRGLVGLFFYSKTVAYWVIGILIQKSHSAEGERCRNVAFFLYTVHKVSLIYLKSCLVSSLLQSVVISVMLCQTCTAATFAYLWGILLWDWFTHKSKDSCCIISSWWIMTIYRITLLSVCLVDVSANGFLLSPFALSLLRSES